MTSEDKARPHFEKYMGNLTMKIDRLESGQYTDSRVDNMWMDYLVGWTHCALFAAHVEHAGWRERLDELRGMPP